MISLNLFETSGAEFSPCGQYRYKLWRKWSDQPPLLFIMLNPSTADELKNDNTVEVCERRAREYGYGGLMVANIFAMRSTYPEDLYVHQEPIGPKNNEAILDLARQAGMVVCGWGKHGNLMNRGTEVLNMLNKHGIKPHYLMLNTDGSPRHPLYVSYKEKPKAWN